MPWSTTEISTWSSSARGDDHAGALGGVGDGVGDQVADRGADLLLRAEDLQAVLAARDHDDLLGRRLDGARVDGGGDRRVDVDHDGRLERVVALEPGELDDLLHQPGEPVALDLHPVGEALHRLGVVGGVDDRLGEQADRADGRLQLVADVGHEVAADRLDALLARAVLDQDQHQPGAQRAPRGRSACGRCHRRRGELELALADLAVAADLRDEVDAARARRAVLPRTSPKAYAGAEALTTWSDSSTTTALERRMLSTAATPACTTRLLDAGAGVCCWRSLMCHASTAPPATRPRRSRRAPAASSDPRSPSYASAHGPASPSGRAGADSVHPRVHRRRTAVRFGSLESGPCVRLSMTSSTASSPTSSEICGPVEVAVHEATGRC